MYINQIIIIFLLISRRFARDGTPTRRSGRCEKYRQLDRVGMNIRDEPEFSLNLNGASVMGNDEQICISG